MHFSFKEQIVGLRNATTPIVDITTHGILNQTSWNAKLCVIRTQIALEWQTQIVDHTPAYAIYV